MVDTTAHRDPKGGRNQGGGRRLGRRHLLVRTAQLGAIATGLGGDLFENWQAADWPPDLVLDEVTIAGVPIRVIEMQHNQAAWVAHRDRITSAIAEAGVVLPEYYPPEYSNVRGAMFLYNDMNAAFDHMADVARSLGKDVVVVDPEHDVAGIALRVALNVPLLALLGLAGRIALSSHHGRRDLFQAAAVGGLAIPTGIVADSCERLVRRVISTHNLVISCESGMLQPSDRATLFYPRGNWVGDSQAPGMRRFLADPEAREVAYSIIQQALGPSLPTLFQTRRYPRGIVSRGQPPKGAPDHVEPWATVDHAATVT